MQSSIFWQSLCLVFLFVALLSDVFVTRWGVWYYGFVEKNRLMRWFVDPVHTFRTFLDCMLRLFLTFVIAAFIRGAGLESDAYWYVPLIFSAPSVFFVAKNLRLVIRLRSKK